MAFKVLNKFATITYNFNPTRSYPGLSITKSGGVVILGETVGVQGATGLNMLKGGTLINSGYVYGAFGGTGDSATTYVGAEGGIGADISGTAVVYNDKLIQGGLGGQGADYHDYFGYPKSGQGGQGGTGLFTGTGVYINNNATIQGGGGGPGASGILAEAHYYYFVTSPGTGGIGGFGIVLGSGDTLNNVGTVSGGRGGNGGTAPDFVRSGKTYTGTGGTGGFGGTGVYATSPAEIINYSVIEGGGAGSGGLAPGGGSVGSVGHIGAGVYFKGGGTIQNGNYDDPGALINDGLSFGSNGNGVVINYGVINGGAGSNAEAIYMGPNSNLVVENDSAIVGFALGGKTSEVEFAGPRVGYINDSVSFLFSDTTRLDISTPTSNSDFYNFETILIDGAVHMSVSGSGTISPKYEILLHGRLDGPGTLTVAGTAGTYSAGLIEMFGGQLEMGSLVNDGGVILYGTVTGNIDLSGGVFYAAGGNSSVTKVLDLSGATFSSMKSGILAAGYKSTLQMPNNQDLSVLSIEAALNGLGSVIEEYNTVSKSEVTLDAALVSITSTGTLVIGGGRNFVAGHAVTSAGSIQLNSGTISGGALTLSAGGLAGRGEADNPLTVLAGATVSANGTLTLAPSNHTIINQGLMQAPGSGYRLVISQAAVNNTVGTVTAGAGDLVLASSGIYGGSISSATGGGIYALSGANTLAMSGGTITNGGQMYTYGGSSLTLGHAHVTNTGGSVQVGTSSLLSLYDSVVYGGAMRVDGGGTLSATGNVNTISLAGGTIANGGTIQTAAGGALTLNGEVVANVSGVVIAGTGPGHLLLNNSTIYGGKISVAAGGAIDAHYVSNSLAMAGGTITNAGTIDTLHSAHLTISQASIANTGTILAQGYSGLITLTKDTVTGAGVLSTQASGGPGCEILIGDTSSVQVQGVQSNAGTIALASASGNTDLRILAGGASLTGGGVVLMTGTKARILGATAATTLTNVDNTISGTGFLGANSLTLINQAKGVIDAVGAFGLTVGTKGETLVNQGLMEATGGGSLVIANTTVVNTGTLLATNLSPVKLQDSVIRGGSLIATGSGVVKFNVSGGELDGTASAVSLSGVMALVTTSNEAFEGAIVNVGKINLTAGGATADLIIGAAGATFSGGGQINLSNSVGNRIYGLAAGDTLTNVDNRIDGAGLLGNGVMTLVNDASGQIIGNQNLAFTIDTGTNTITNAGLIENVGKGGTTVKSAVANTGTLEAATAGTLTIVGAVTGTGIGVINGGTLYVQQALAEKVNFTGSTGVLELGASQAFTGTVVGLSKTGTSWLDLVDIGFTVANTKASYSGTTASGTLTVTDGTHTAHITLVGNFVGSTWTVSSDGHGGTKVVDPPAGATPLAQAISAFPAPASPSAGAWTPRPPPRQLLAHAQT